MVVGSGPAGATAALFLCRAGADVTLLEAGAERAARGLTVRVGGFTVLKQRRELRQREAYDATGDPDTKLFEDLAPGGLSNHWSCAVPRFSPDDFADGARAGEPTAWPIGYDDLRPWYEQVEPLLRIAGAAENAPQLPAGKVRRARRLGRAWTTVAAQALEVGRSLLPMPYAYGGETTVTFSGTVFNSYVRLLKDELRARHMATVYDARVVRLEWSPQSRRVEAVVFQDRKNRSEQRVPCCAVVLAAGAIATAEILLASRSSEFPVGLGDTHGVLGRYLHDHPLGKLVVDLGLPMPVHPPCYLTRENLDRAQPLYAAACMQWSGVDTILRSLKEGNPGRSSEIGFSVFGTMAPTPDNYVAFDGGAKDTRGLSRLALHIRHPPEARHALDKACEDAVELLRRAGLRPRVRIWHVEPPGESKHYGGTCRMHASPAYGMLNAWSRMHAARNVVVADSAAFTTGPEKNPVLTAMALSARGSSRLATDLRDGAL